MANQARKKRSQNQKQNKAWRASYCRATAKPPIGVCDIPCMEQKCGNKCFYLLRLSIYL